MMTNFAKVSIVCLFSALIFTAEAQGDPVFSVDDPCEDIAPFSVPCELENVFLRMRYVGGYCEDSSNRQTAEQFICEDIDPRPPFDEVFRLEAADANNQFIFYYGGEVMENQTFVIGDDYEMSWNTNITIMWDDGDVFQTIVMGSSCQNRKLFLGDTYGALQLIGFGNYDEEISCSNRVPVIDDDDDDDDNYNGCNGNDGKKGCGKKSKKGKDYSKKGNGKKSDRRG
mmetsp:Transcript_27469/g.40576  ORF Transcript_27469/g.40576 Transcript_27469/m.40576 type:complete len:227 (-) Transcript_27469:37-717(-)